MDGQPEGFEGNYLALAGPPADRALDLRSILEPGNYVYLLSDTRYARYSREDCDKPAHEKAMEQAAQGHVYDNGIERFIEAALAEKECKGFISVTGGAIGPLARMELQIIKRGEPAFFLWGRD